eukprot:2724788-Ditylum_brightwellii.AAC.1
MDITVEDVERMASCLSGARGAGSTNAVSLCNWLLRFGASSEELREEMAQWASWLSNSSPPWAAYWTTMVCRLVALDKSPGTRLVGIREIYWHLWAKLVLQKAGDQAKMACCNLQLCAGLEAGIEGTVHAVWHRWEKQLAVAREAVQGQEMKQGAGKEQEAGGYDDELPALFERMEDNKEEENNEEDNKTEVESADRAMRPDGEESKNQDTSPLIT